MDEQEYRQIPGLRSSVLTSLRKSPAHAKAAEDPKSKDSTTALKFGSFIHTLLLEPDKLADQFILSPYKDFRTKEAQAWRDAQTKQIVKSQEEIEAATEVNRKVWEHKIAGKIFRDIVSREELVQWIEPEFQIPCKARADAQTAKRYLIDIKTTQDARPQKFWGSFYKYGYHLQAAHYSEGLVQNGVELQGVLIIAIESSAPYDVVVYELTNELLREAHVERRQLLKTYAECTKSGIWPGNGEKMVKLDTYETMRDKFYN